MQPCVCLDSGCGCLMQMAMHVQRKLTSCTGRVVVGQCAHLRRMEHWRYRLVDGGLRYAATIRLMY